MRNVAARMQRRLSCTTDPIEEAQPPAGCSPSRALSQYHHHHGSAKASGGGGTKLRRTSAQDSIDSAFSMLMASRRKGSDSNVGQIQPDLYRRRGSTISIGSNGGPSAGVIGRLQLQLSYDHSRSDLLVRIVQATLNLPIPSQLNNGQPCRIRLSIQQGCHPQQQQHSQHPQHSAPSSSSVGNKPRESEPITFNDDGQWTSGSSTGTNTNNSSNNNVGHQQQQQQQPNTFKFPLGYNELGDAQLLVEMLAIGHPLHSSSSSTMDGKMANGSGSGGHAVGSILSPCRHALCAVPLGSLGPSADDLTVWADLERASEAMIRGEMLLCLQYLPAAERLTLSIHQAANLHLSSQHGGGGSSSGFSTTDLFIRAQLVGPEEKVLKRRKSGTRKVAPGDSVVVWDEVIGFEKVEPNGLAKCRLDILLFGSDRFGRGERAFGQISFGPIGHRPLPSSSSSSSSSRLWPPDLGRWTVPRWIPLEPVDIGTSEGPTTTTTTTPMAQQQQ